MSDMFKNKFSREQIGYLKASDVRNLREKERAMVAVVASIMVMTFVIFVLAVAQFIWNSKLTLFLLIISCGPAAFLWYVHAKGVQSYKQLLSEIEDRINSQEKQTL